MNNFFYARLAANNIKKNKQIYIPYIITCIITISFYYIMKSLSLNEGINDLWGGATVSYTLGLGCKVVMIFAVIFLFYTNSFLMKRREKEFGLFHVLGMEKKHLMKVVGLETIYIGIVSLAIGFLFGIALDKVMFLMLLRLLDTEIPLGFYISKEAILSTIVLFGAIFVFIFLNAVRRLQSSKPVELLKGENVGEKEPKAKWFLALLGALCLGAGYYLAVTVENPLEALTVFFVAVILVILGTYLLFTAGSIALLKLLRSNKRYYYRTRHFIGVSGMLYRMKQNAVGLANICILSTMVLVMVSSTTSLVIGMNDIITARYPNEYNVYLSDGAYDENNQAKMENAAASVKNMVSEVLAGNGLEATESQGYRYLDFAAAGKDGNYSVTQEMNYWELDNLCEMAFLSLDDYNAMTGENVELNDHEVMVYCGRDDIESDTVLLDGYEFQVVKRLDQFVGNGEIASNIVNTYFFIVNSPKIIDSMYLWQKEIYGENCSNIQYYYGVESDGEEETLKKAYEEINNRLSTMDLGGVTGYADCRAQSRNNFYGLYGGLFFIGIFLGLLFTVAAILMIYYKQITEGYYDRDRYIIMQNVGMSQKDVKASIHSQILTVFFLPLLTAGVHIIFAYPVIEKILACLNLMNTRLYIYCTVGCFAVFALLYVFVYTWTAKLYYGIVRK